MRQGLEHAITETDFDLAALNNEQFLCRVTLPEDDIASLEVARGNAGTCQKSKINRRICHIGTRALNIYAVGAASIHALFVFAWIAVNRVDPQDRFRLLHRLDIEIDRDRFAVAAHQDAF